MRRGAFPLGVVACICIASIHAGPGIGGEAFAGDSSGAETKVVLVSMKSCCPGIAWPEVEDRVTEELLALGIRVESVNGARMSEGHGATELAAMFNGRGPAVAGALRVIRTAGGGTTADLLYRDRLTGNVVFKHLAFNPVAGAEGLSVAALRIVELLTAGMLELANPAPARVRSPSPPPAAPERPSPPATLAEQPAVAQSGRTPAGGGEAGEHPSRVRMIAGGGGALAPGNVTLLPAGSVAVNWAFSKPVAVEAEVLLTLPGRTVAHGGREVDIFEAPVRLWALWNLMTHGPLGVTIGGGAGVVILEARGKSTASHRGIEDLAATGYVGATGRLGMALSEILTAGLAINVGTMLPIVDVRYAQNDVLSFGLPSAEAMLNIGVRVW